MSEIQSEARSLKIAPMAPRGAPAVEQSAKAMLSIEDIAQRFDALAEYCDEHGDYQKKQTEAFAENLRAHAKRFADDFVAAERRRLIKIEQLVADLIGHG